MNIKQNRDLIILKYQIVSLTRILFFFLFKSLGVYLDWGDSSSRCGAYRDPTQRASWGGMYLNCVAWSI